MALRYFPNIRCLLQRYKDVFHLGGSFLCPLPVRLRFLFMTEHIRKVNPFSCEMKNTFLQPFKVLFLLSETSQLQKWMAPTISQHSTTSNTHTRIRHCCKINEMQLFRAHALQQSGVKHTIVWQQAKVSAAAESAAFSLEWDLQSPRPYLWHINIRFNIQEEEPFWQWNQTKQISKFSWIGTARWSSVPWAKQRERKKKLFSVH